MMKKTLTMLLALLLVGGAVWAQDKPGKRERKKNLVVKEWNTKQGSKTPYLDNVVTYDELGRKVEEIEYASYGQKKRVTYEYEGTNTKCVLYSAGDSTPTLAEYDFNSDNSKWNLRSNH